MLGTTIQTLKIGDDAEKSSDVFYATENVCDGYVSYLFLTISYLVTMTDLFMLRKLYEGDVTKKQDR